MAINRLTFDVLGHIFSHYADEETIQHPLETLLLVCGRWQDAALGHRALWSDFKIYLGHSPTSVIWKKRLPPRLARAGPTVPLYISLFNILDIVSTDSIPPSFREDRLYNDFYCTNPYPAKWPLCEDFCPCYKDARECAEFALDCLTGTDGIFCVRWKKFHVNLGYGPQYDPSRKLATTICYPTPSLTSLHVANLILDERDDEDLAPLMEMPQLQELLVEDCYLFNVLDFQALRGADLHGSNLAHLGELSNLRSACQLESVCLRYFQAEGILLPDRLLSLSSLEIIGEELPPDFYVCEIPNLSAITLNFEDHDLVIDILSCPGINVEKLEKLTLIWADIGLNPTVWNADECEDLLGSLFGLFNRAPNLSYVAGNRNILNLFLKVLWDSWSDHGTDRILGSKQFMLHFIVSDHPRDLHGGETVKLGADDGLQTLKKLARDWGLLPPDIHVEKFLGILTRGWPYSQFDVFNGFPEESEEEDEEQADT